MEECPDCNGDGKVVDEVRTCDTRKVIVECDTCHGLGKVKEEDERCPECGVGPYVEHDPNCPTQ